MLTELCQEIKNWFDRDRVYGTFTIENGALAVDFLQPGQYFRVIGSIFNDGVHRWGGSAPELLTDETFEGAVWTMALPVEVLQLSQDIDAWQAKYGGADSPAMSPFQSESFGGYSYSKAAGGSGSGGGSGLSWQGAFASRLNAWRKL